MCERTVASAHSSTRYGKYGNRGSNITLDAIATTSHYTTLHSTLSFGVKLNPAVRELTRYDGIMLCPPRSWIFLSSPLFLIAYRFKEAEAAQLDRAYVYLTLHVCSARHLLCRSFFPVFAFRAW